MYIAAPSPFSDTTLRPGQATAAPTARGMPWPIAPPVSASQSCGRAPRVWVNTGRLAVTESSETTAPSGMCRAIEVPTVWPLIAPLGASGVSRLLAGPWTGAPIASASCSSARAPSWPRSARLKLAQPSGISTLGAFG